MAFIDDFNKLVVKNGKQQKIANKDKAIIDLANEVANGGGGQTKRIVAGWKEISENEFEKIDKKEGEEKFEINTFTNLNKTLTLFTTDENEPNPTFENVALIVNTEGHFITTINIRAITKINSSSTMDEDNLVVPNTVIDVFDAFDMQSTPYLSISIIRERIE